MPPFSRLHPFLTNPRVLQHTTKLHFVLTAFSLIIGLNNTYQLRSLEQRARKRHKHLNQLMMGGSVKKAMVWELMKGGGGGEERRNKQEADEQGLENEEGNDNGNENGKEVWENDKNGEEVWNEDADGDEGAKGGAGHDRTDTKREKGEERVESQETRESTIGKGVKETRFQAQAAKLKSGIEKEKVGDPIEDEGKRFVEAEEMSDKKGGREGNKGADGSKKM